MTLPPEAEDSAPGLFEPDAELRAVVPPLHDGECSEGSGTGDAMPVGGMDRGLVCRRFSGCEGGSRDAEEFARALSRMHTAGAPAGCTKEKLLMEDRGEWAGAGGGVAGAGSAGAGGGAAAALLLGDSAVGQRSELLESVARGERPAGTKVAASSTVSITGSSSGCVEGGAGDASLSVSTCLQAPMRGCQSDARRCCWCLCGDKPFG